MQHFRRFSGCCISSSALGTGSLKSRAQSKRSARATAPSAHDVEAVGTRAAPKESESIKCITFRIFSCSTSFQVAGRHHMLCPAEGCPTSHAPHQNAPKRTTFSSFSLLLRQIDASAGLLAPGVKLAAEAATHGSPCIRAAPFSPVHFPQLPQARSFPTQHAKLCNCHSIL
jgi:hypothetical protein